MSDDNGQVEMQVCAFGGTVTLFMDTPTQEQRIEMTAERTRALAQQLIEAAEFCEQRAARAKQ